MRGARLAGALCAWLALAFLPGCGGGSDEPAEVVPFGGGPLAAEVEPDMCLMILLDGVRASELQGPDLAKRFPALASLRAASTDAGPAIAVSTGGNASLATVLTGESPAMHGVLSLRDLGRARLRDRLGTLAERLGAKGWRTVAALPSPRHARGLSGFAQGFDVYEAPRPGERERSAGDVVASLGRSLEEALEAEGRVFLMAGFSDGLSRVAPIHHPRAAEVVERWMAPVAAGNARVTAALETLRDDADDGLEEFGRLFARARGGRLATAWESALSELRIAAIDSAVARILDAIEASGRADRTMVVLGGLRGRGERGVEGGPRLSGPSIEVPLWVRAPGKRIGLLDPAGDADRARGPHSVRDLYWFCHRAFLDEGAGEGEAPEPGTGARRAYASTIDWSLHALRTATRHYERYADGELVAFEGAVSVPMEDAEREEVARWLAQQAEPAAFLVDAVPDGFDVRWQLAEGALLPEAGSRRSPPVRGGLAEIKSGSGGRYGAYLGKRSTAIRVGVRGDGASPRALKLGVTSASRLPVMFLPAEGAPTYEEVKGTPPPRLALTRASGLDWNLTVTGKGLPEGARAEVLLTVWPPREPSELLEVPVANVTLTHVEGRRDLVHLEGPLPFDVLVKRSGKERFAVACAVEGTFLEPREMMGDGDLYAGQDRFDVLLPSWQPGVSDVMGDLTGALYAITSVPGEGEVVLRRAGIGIGLDGTNAIPFDALEFVRTLPPYE